MMRLKQADGCNKPKHVYDYGEEINSGFSSTKNPVFDEYGYLILKDFIDVRGLVELPSEERGLRYNEKGELKEKLKVEKQVAGSLARYNLSEKYRKVSIEIKNKLQEIIGMRLHETYCFDRFYFVDNYLPYHTDREACEISVTLHISTNTHKPWHIGIKSAKGDFQLANLHAGDAMVYKGIERPHWRNPLESRHSKRRQLWHKLIGKKDDTYYHQVFFHYVMDDGHYVHYAGDTQLTSEDERQPNQYLID